MRASRILTFSLAGLWSASAWCGAQACQAQSAPVSRCGERALAAAASFEPAVAEQLRAAQAAIVGRPSEAAARGRLGMALHRYQLLEAAAACYAEAVALAPGEPRWLRFHALALAELGRTDEALAAVELALAAISRAPGAEPRAAPAWLQRAELLFDLGRLDESLAAAAEARRLAPESAAAAFLSGRALAGLNRPAEAAAAFERAIELAPDHAPAHYGLAQALRRLGRSEQARAALQAYSRLGAAPPPAPEDPLAAELSALDGGAGGLIERGNLAARAGDAEAALAAFQAALALQPRLIVAHSNLIVLHGERGELEPARKHYELARRIDPGWSEAHAAWARLMARQRRWPEAAEAFGRAVASSPHQAGLRLELGGVLDALGRPAEAAVQYRAALDSDPLHPEARSLLGQALLRDGRIEEGLDEIERSIASDGARAAADLAALSRVHETDGNLEIALGYARRALGRVNEGAEAELAETLRQAIARLEARVRP